MIFNFHAVVAIAVAFQLLSGQRRAFAPCRSVDVFLPIRTSTAVLVSRLVGVVSWFSFAHSSMYLSIVSVGFEEVFALALNPIITFMSFVTNQLVWLSRPFTKDVRAMVAKEARPWMRFYHI